MKIKIRSELTYSLYQKYIASAPYWLIFDKYGGKMAKNITKFILYWTPVSIKENFGYVEKFLFLFYPFERLLT